MDDIIAYILIVFLISAFTYGLIIQIKKTLFIIKLRKNTKEVLGNIICSISYGGFLLSYILNVLVALQFIKGDVITSENTSFSCGTFLVLLLISKYVIIPKSAIE